MRTYRPTSHESAMDHASRSSLWTGSLARNGFLFFVQTVRKIITGRLKASWRVGCEGVRRSGKSMGESRRMGRNSSQQNLEGRPPCRPWKKRVMRRRRSCALQGRWSAIFWRDDLRVVRGRVTQRRRSGALQGRWDAIYWRDDLCVVRGFGRDGAAPQVRGFRGETARCGWFLIGRFFRGFRWRRLCRLGSRLRGRCRGCGRLQR